MAADAAHIVSSDAIDVGEYTRVGGTIGKAAGWRIARARIFTAPFVLQCVHLRRGASSANGQGWPTRAATFGGTLDLT
jgi:hypothetical protein